ncbi:MAG TPA: holo-ACP synthase [Candidatus Methylomirabilis sp.]
MVIGIGTDLVAVDRFAASLERWGDRLLDRVFTDGERRECLAHPAALEHAAVRLASRFAAKEAAFKALGTGWGQGVRWRDVEVVGGGSKAPAIHLAGRAEEVAWGQGVRRALLSLAHERGYALAFVLTTDD